MKQLLKIIFTEFKLFLREPVAAFFTFIFPLFFLFIIMEIFVPKDPPKEVIVNYIVPPLMVLILATIAIFGIPSSVVSYRQIKFFKRLKATPVTSFAILGGLCIANFIITILGIFLLVLGGMLIYNAKFGGDILTFSLGFILVFLSLAATFLIIAGVCRTERTSYAVSNIIFFPLMFFSGVFVPLDMLPDWIAKNISPFIPTTHAVELLKGLWLGNPLFDYSKEIIILFGFLIFGLIISAKTFRWE